MKTPNAPSADLKMWDVVEKPIFVDGKALDGYKAILRSDNGGVLNVAKKSYTPTTNARFIEVCETMSKITGFPIQTYDEFHNGRKTLAFLKSTSPMKVRGYDFNDYLMIGNSHDGSTGFFMGNSNLMIRCQNRFSKQFRQLKVYHTANQDIKIDSLIGEFEKYKKEQQQMVANLEKFADVKVNAKIKDALIARLTKMSAEEKAGTKADLSTRKSNLVDQYNVAIDHEYKDLGKNAFALFNGVTYYTSNMQPKKQEVFGNAMGGLNQINQMAYDFCLELV